MDDIDHLAEISDDPDDEESDYGRGYRHGWKAAASRIAADLRRMKAAQETAHVFLAAIAYDGAAALARLTGEELDDEDSHEDRVEATVTADPGGGYEEFVTAEHFTEPVTHVAALWKDIDQMNVCISIGNSDHKLSQARWAEFVQIVSHVVYRVGKLEGAQVHGEYFSPTAAPWQNACWWLQLPTDPMRTQALRSRLRQLRAEYEQTSIAWLAGETEFL